MKIKLFLDGLLKISGALFIGILAHELTHVSQFKEPLYLILSPTKSSVASVIGYGELCCGGEFAASALGLLVTASALYYVVQENIRKLEEFKG